jgi:3-oxoacyl-[acyl-carrier-protein] synthase-3
MARALTTGEHGLILEAGGSEPAGSTGRPALPTRLECIGVKLPGRILTTRELMASTRHRTSIDLERLTGIRQRHVCSEGEDSYTLAVDAARDCLARSRHAPDDIEMLISTSITRYKGGLRHQWEPPLSLAIKQAIGAPQATSFDLSNACAGMLSGVFILHDFIRRGVIRCGMAVSGEYISSLGRNAARQIRWILSRQLASLTLGDAGAAVIVERADPAGDPDDRIAVAGFTTLSEHSRLCLGAPSKVGPGASMWTRARTIHKVAVAESPPLLQEALAQAGVGYDEIDYVIPHQTSARAIEKGAQAIAERLGVKPKHVVVTVDEFGNTSSTTHFLALHKYLREHRFEKGHRIMLLSFASGLEVGVMIFAMGGLVDRYGRAD